MYIGIGGVSRSGKSMLAKALSTKLDGSVSIFDQDEYVLEKSTIPKIQGRIDWETPLSIDWDKLHQAVQNAQDRFKIVEGIFAFSNEQLNELYDFKIHLNVSHQEYLSQRRKETRWGKEPAWYIQYVWDAYEKRVNKMNLKNFHTFNIYQENLSILTDQLAEKINLLNRK